MKKLLFGKRMWFMLIGTVVVFGLLFFGQWFGQKKMNEFFDAMPMPPVAVSDAAARVERWQPTLQAVGTLRPVNGAELTTEVGGILDSVRFANGERVKQGDIIATLNLNTDRAQLEALRAAAQLATVELRRTAQLVKTRSISQAEVDRRQSELDQAKANVAAQEARIEEKILRAPFDGILGIRQVNVGQFVAAGDPIIELQQLDPLYVNFNLPEQYIEEIGIGRRVRVRLDALDGAEFLGAVTAVEPSVDIATRNFMVQATLRNEELRLRPGMFATIQVDRGDARDMVVVPRTAISYKPYGNSVFVLSKEPIEGGERPQYSVEQRFVTLGQAHGDVIEIVDGLVEGERIATNALLRLRTGVVVIVDNRQKPAAELNPTPEPG